MSFKSIKRQQRYFNFMSFYLMETTRFYTSVNYMSYLFFSSKNTRRLARGVVSICRVSGLGIGSGFKPRKAQKFLLEKQAKFTPFQRQTNQATDRRNRRETQPWIRSLQRFLSSSSASKLPSYGRISIPAPTFSLSSRYCFQKTLVSLQRKQLTTFSIFCIRIFV